MLLQPRAERDLVVLEDEDRRDPLYRCEVRALVCGGGLGRAVPHPGEGDARLVLQLEGQRDAGDHRHHVAHVGDRLEHAVGEGADVEVAAARRRIVRRQVGPQHVGDRHPQLAAGGGVADHRRDDVAPRPALERVHRANRRRLLSRAEPRLGEHTGADPALELDVVEAGPQQTGVQLELRLRGESCHDRGPLGGALHGRPELAHQGRVGLPGDVLRGIERGKALHGRLT